MNENRSIKEVLSGVEVEWKKLEDIFDIIAGGDVPKKALSNEKTQEYNIPILSNGISDKALYGWTNNAKIIKPSLTVSARGTIGWTSYQEKPFFPIVRLLVLTPKIKLNLKYAYYFMKTIEKNYNVSKNGIPQLTKPMIKDKLIPIPPLEAQRKIVEVLDNFTELTAELTAELSARKKQYNYYRDKLLTFKDVEVEWKKLEDIFDIIAGGDVPKKALSNEKTQEYNIPILSNGISDKALYGWTNNAKIIKPSLTVSARGTIGWTSYQEKPFFPIVRLLVLTPKIKLNLKYAYYFMKTIEKNYNVSKNGIPQLTKPMIKDKLIPIPALEKQKEIVAILDKFDTLTNSISEGLPKEIDLRQKQYEYYRDMFLSFEKEK